MTYIQRHTSKGKEWVANKRHLYRHHSTPTLPHRKHLYRLTLVILLLTTLAYLNHHHHHHQQEQEHLLQERILTHRTQANPTRRALVGAYYYHWYTPHQWDLFTCRYEPKLGLYASEDAQVHDRHVQWTRQADIDFWIVSWDYHHHDAVLALLQRPGTPRIALHLESVGMYGGKQTPPIDFLSVVENRRTKAMQPFGDIMR